MPYKRLMIAAIVLLCIEAGVINSGANGQTLLLPSPSGFVQGTGGCSDLIVGIATRNWRVRKGDVFEVFARSFSGEPDIRYRWTISNGKIVSGQGTPKVEIKAGGTKTPGYINVSGFVRVTLVVERIKDENRCSLEISESIMVGRNREVNQFANVEELVLDEIELKRPCPPDQEPSEGERISDDMIVEVTVVARDPENDVLTYNYSVSGGRITGNGFRIKWDLSEAPPGTYTIRAAVDDGFGIFGKTQTKTITVLSQPSCVGTIEGSKHYEDGRLKQ